MLYRWPILTLSLFAVGCSSNADSLAPEFDAYEAVIRDHVQRVRVPAGRQLVVYLSLDPEEPPAAFLRRFDKEPFRVEPAKAHEKGNDQVFAVFMTLCVGERNGSDRVRLMAFVHDETERPTCGTPWPIPVVRRDGCWIVEP